MFRRSNHFSRFALIGILFLGLIFMLLNFSSGPIGDNDNGKEMETVFIEATEYKTEKQRGAHVFGVLDSANLGQFRDMNIEWITLVPYAGQEDYDSPTVRYLRGDSLRNARAKTHWVNQIEIARGAGFKVFVKPHIWLHSPPDGKWRSDIFPSSEDNWNLWKQSYREFIMHYARIAELAGAEMFCVGTEFSRLTIEKPKFWKDLIRDLRSVYTGKLTYAANWYNEFEEISFWEDLDYIGIQAYFPLLKNNDPSVMDLRTGWKKQLSAIEAVHQKYEREILFTELGYKSTSDSAIKPWEWMDYSKDAAKHFSTSTQANCYQAFFDTVWDNQWFAGVHLWQMRSDYLEDEEAINLDFTPQGKPAEKVIARGFAKE